MDDFTLRLTHRSTFGDRVVERSIEFDSYGSVAGDAAPWPKTAPTSPIRVDSVSGVDVGSVRQRYVRIGADGKPAATDIATDAVLDTTTGLMWTRTVLADRVNFADAKAACERLNTAGFNDWVLPTVQQLLTLVDYSRMDPAIDVEAFPETKSAFYWTSTPWAGSPASAAWVVYFDGGDAGYYDHDGAGFVRAVRRASPAGQ